MLLVLSLVTCNGFVIGFQGVSAKAAAIANLEAHDDEEDDHMSLRSFYWFVVSKKKQKQKTPHLVVLDLFIMLHQKVVESIYKDLRLFHHAQVPQEQEAPVTV